MAETATVETPVTPPETPEQPISVADHAAQFGPDAKQAGEDGAETPAERQQRRDRETGQFQPGRVRHRAKSQQASPEDVPLISGYTKRIKQAEEAVTDITPKEGESPRAFELRRRAELIERVAKAKAPASQPSTVTTPAMPVLSAPVGTFMEPEPKIDDFVGKSDDPYAAWTRASAAWDRRKEAHETATKQAEAQQQQFTQQATAYWQNVAATHAGRVAEFAKTHPDFMAKIQAVTTPIPPALGIAMQLMEDGPAKMLQLAENPDMVDELFLMTDGKPVSETLVAAVQRRLSRGSQTAGTNGAASRSSTVVLPPKPPTPLRTEAQRVTGQPPPTDGSLSMSEHRKAFAPKPRR